ncbi:hypothetical protein LPJ38_29570 [Bradyrhizobium daqingense]|uniref:Uncharacterized protein n=1 Tax=Bradyrhizobium daqingense TaxID=993502 RepID=A0A562KG86_9BRAD|nr:hypothetical protein [Bradyrhizobium daqingense]TWH94275.1 hypothetical protein IQ17_06821 [Bradyrhizobium daqingense]UFS87748.1 hypothetical protein LPJ38_29570 [Bradyrhizobium daqingense]
MNVEELKIAIEAMPAEIQDELKRMRSSGRGLLGKVTTQMIVDRHLPLLVWFRKKLHADHTVLSMLLHLHGISGPDGEPLTVGTVSSAFSRAVKAAELSKFQAGTGNPVKAQKRAGPKRSAATPASVPRPAQHRPVLNVEANSFASAPPRVPITLEPLALTPISEVPARRRDASEIRRADHARLMLIDPTQED